MARRNSKEKIRAIARVLPRQAHVLAALDRVGGPLVEGIAGLWLGIALAALVACAASADIGRYVTGEALMPTPDRLCQAVIGQSPSLDGDRVTLGESVLVCDGTSGNWETTDARAQRLARLMMPPLAPMD
jgi:hypothetical protein